MREDINLANLLCIRFDFGIPLEDIFPSNDIHPRLKYLFLLTYYSVKSSGEPLNIILRNQSGFLEEGLRLKTKILESESFITSAKPSSYFWVLRHFLGLLPIPLLPTYTNGMRLNWSTLGEKCQFYLQSATKDLNVAELDCHVSRQLLQLPIEHIRLLDYQLQLMKKLSLKHKKLHRKSLVSLVSFFSAAIFVRPYRPGLITQDQIIHRYFLIYLTIRWPLIKRALALSNNATESIKAKIDGSCVNLKSDNQSSSYISAIIDDNPNNIEHFEDIFSNRYIKKYIKRISEKKETASFSCQVDFNKGICSLCQKNLSLSDLINVNSKCCCRYGSNYESDKIFTSKKIISDEGIEGRIEAKQNTEIDSADEKTSSNSSYFLNSKKDEKFAETKLIERKSEMAANEALSHEVNDVGITESFIHKSITELSSVRSKEKLPSSGGEIHQKNEEAKVEKPELDSVNRHQKVINEIKQMIDEKRIDCGSFATADKKSKDGETIIHPKMGRKASASDSIDSSSHRGSQNQNSFVFNQDQNNAKDNYIVDGSKSRPNKEICFNQYQNNAEDDKSVNLETHNKSGNTEARRKIIREYEKMTIFRRAIKENVNRMASRRLSEVSGHQIEIEDQRRRRARGGAKSMNSKVLGNEIKTTQEFQPSAEKSNCKRSKNGAIGTSGQEKSTRMKNNQEKYLEEELIRKENVSKSKEHDLVGYQRERSANATEVKDFKPEQVGKSKKELESPQVKKNEATGSKVNRLDGGASGECLGQQGIIIHKKKEDEKEMSYKSEAPTDNLVAKNNNNTNSDKEDEIHSRTELLKGVKDNTTNSQTIKMIKNVLRRMFNNVTKKSSDEEDLKEILHADKQELTNRQDATGHSVTQNEENSRITNKLSNVNLSTDYLTVIEEIDNKIETANNHLNNGSENILGLKKKNEENTCRESFQYKKLSNDSDEGTLSKEINSVKEPKEEETKIEEVSNQSSKQISDRENSTTSPIFAKKLLDFVEETSDTEAGTSSLHSDGDSSSKTNVLPEETTLLNMTNTDSYMYDDYDTFKNERFNQISCVTKKFTQSTPNSSVTVDQEVFSRISKIGWTYTPPDTPSINLNPKQTKLELLMVEECEDKESRVPILANDSATKSKTSLNFQKIKSKLKLLQPKQKGSEEDISSNIRYKKMHYSS